VTNSMHVRSRPVLEEAHAHGDELRVRPPNEDGGGRGGHGAGAAAIQPDPGVRRTGAAVKERGRNMEGGGGRRQRDEVTGRWRAGADGGETRSANRF
jgi:hypothetical protein